jgi:hypothetical protein
MAQHPRLAGDWFRRFRGAHRRSAPSTSGISLVQATLPDLAGLGDACFANVLCETVIMHLPADAAGAAVVRLMAILEPGGTLYLSWRVAAQADVRDPAGRLYTAFASELVLGAHGACEILYDRKLESLSSARVIRQAALVEMPSRRPRSILDRPFLPWASRRMARNHTRIDSLVPCKIVPAISEV